MCVCTMLSDVVIACPALQDLDASDCSHMNLTIEVKDVIFLLVRLIILVMLAIGRGSFSSRP